MAVGKEIKNKIGSVENTMKITSAMQMVAASKMRRTQDRMAEGKPYAEKIRAVIGHLANSNPEYRHTFMEERDVNRVGYPRRFFGQGVVRRLERQSVPHAGARHCRLA